MMCLVSLKGLGKGRSTWPDTHVEYLCFYCEIGWLEEGGHVFASRHGSPASAVVEELWDPE